MPLSLGIGLSPTRQFGLDPYALLPRTGLISEYKFLEGTGTTANDSVGTNHITGITNGSWVSSGLNLASGLAATPSITGARTVVTVCAVGRGETTAFVLSGGPGGSEGQGVQANAITATWDNKVGRARGVAPVWARDTGALANGLNRGGFKCLFTRYSSAATTKLGFGARHTAGTNACASLRLVYALVYSTVLTSDEETLVYNAMRSVCKSRGVYIDYRDCPSIVDFMLIMGESNPDGRALKASLSAGDQARSTSKTKILASNTVTMPSALYPPATLALGTNQQQTSPSTQFGPEIGIAWAREADSTLGDLWIGKSAEGSSYAAPSSLTGSSTTSWNAVETNAGNANIYNALHNWHDCEDYMLLNGIGPRFKAVLYDLGLNDATSTTYASSASVYKGYMDGIIGMISTYMLGTPQIFVVRTHDSDPGSNPTALATIRTAQADFVAADTTYRQLYDADNLALKADSVHYDHNGMTTLGQAFHGLITWGGS